MFERQIETRFLSTLERMGCGSLLLTLPGGRTHSFAGPRQGPAAELTIHHPRAITAIAAKGDVGFAEAYRDGLLDSPDLAALMTLALMNDDTLSRYIDGNSLVARLLHFLYRFQRNTPEGARRNIHAHYDLGNAFYRLWLDPSMTYSSALFDQNDDLHSAQLRKYDRILEQLDRPSGRILEIGCGWGGFAERALMRGDYGIKGLTLSTEQADFARNRLGRGAEIALQDYRHENGKFDHIVSIEMFEAVGEEFWPAYFAKLRQALSQSGRAVVQTITIDEPHFDSYRRSADMIRSFVFPGGMLPTPTRFCAEAERAGLRIEDSFGFGQDYARTLRDWLARFEDRLADVRALGFDEGFIRIWRAYLAACIASFSTRRTDVVQFRMSHG
ncbi:cyclopropane-fatty-acyl-phospholipid synthase family protein [Sinirhodobacter sp. WL0062]|uniref:Cyclopropane-fatty-acyl-phospholipid synthase family protein n=1 Tax=Rhodobacter flavimaris TaxID=2907145 RepID=A0ABS8YU85_9RHOB|nr:cyclopropane-fatty-acyl-phospholipid synthase family protein [Sinirhodobacter sp. WL0062]MCE5972011.1 cyclopropane-fatty-acyl-phospholipid synthase family protein [Sinirhodobacter sp. WL0062]